MWEVVSVFSRLVLNCSPLWMLFKVWNLPNKLNLLGASKSVWLCLNPKIRVILAFYPVWFRDQHCLFLLSYWLYLILYKMSWQNMTKKLKWIDMFFKKFQILIEFSICSHIFCIICSCISKPPSSERKMTPSITLTYFIKSLSEQNRNIKY